MIHTCAECGLVHDSGTQAAAPSPDVEIARINAERDIAVAKLSARQERDWNETHVEVAEIEAGAQVEAAVAEAEIVGAALEAGVIDPAPDPAPIVIDTDVSADTEADAQELPPAEGSAPPEPSASKRTGLGMW